MKVRLLKPAYLTEDGFVFECGNSDDFSEILKTIGKSASSEEVVAILKAKGIPFRMYKEIAEG